MAVSYVEGDLLTRNECVLIHGCNTLGKMGSGFAGALRKRFPATVYPYFETHRKFGLSLGSVLWVENNGLLVGHCMTQATIGHDGRQHVSYEAIQACMKEVNLAAQVGVPGTSFEKGFSRVAMPLIGAGLAGGDWNIISGIISQEMNFVKPVVYFLGEMKHVIKNTINHKY